MKPPVMLASSTWLSMLARGLCDPGREELDDAPVPSDRLPAETKCPGPTEINGSGVEYDEPSLKEL